MANLQRMKNYECDDGDGDDDDDENAGNIKYLGFLYSHDFKIYLCTDVCTHSMYYKMCFYSTDTDNTFGMSHEGTSYDDLVFSELKISCCLQSNFKKIKTNS